jgi:hypothetical protein
MLHPSPLDQGLGTDPCAEKNSEGLRYTAMLAAVCLRGVWRDTRCDSCFPGRDEQSDECVRTVDNLAKRATSGGGDVIGANFEEGKRMLKHENEEFKFLGQMACLTVLVFTLSSSAHAGLFGPDIVTLTPAELQEKLRDQALTFTTKAAPLEFSSKSAAIGGFVLGLVLSSAVASTGTSTRPGMPAQQRMQNLQNMQQFSKASAGTGIAIGRMVGESMSAQVVKGAAVQTREGPVAWLVPRLQAAFVEAYRTQWRPFIDEKSRSADTINDSKMSLSVDQPVWMVDFSMTSSDYSLKYKIDMVLTDLASKAVNRSINCEGVFEKVMSEEEWKKDDLKAVADASNAIAEQCLDRILFDLNIARAAIADASDIGSANTLTRQGAEDNMQSLADIPSVGLRNDGEANKREMLNGP